MSKNKSKIIYVYIGSAAVIVASLLIWYYLDRKSKYSADTTTMPVIENNVSGTYNSASGSGQIPNNIATIPVDMSQ